MQGERVLLKISDRETVLPLTSDLKFSLIRVNEEGGQALFRDGNRTGAARLLLRNLQLFGRGPRMPFEGLEWMKTLKKLRECGAEIDAGAFPERSSRIAVRMRDGADLIPMELDDAEFALLQHELLGSDEKARREGEPERISQIEQVFRELRERGLVPALSI